MHSIHMVSLEHPRRRQAYDNGENLPLTASCGLVVALVCGSAMVSAQPAVSTESNAFVHPNLIVSVSWLMQHTTDPHLRLVDARPTAEYDKGHIPGAVSLPVADTFDPAQPKNYPDTKEKLEALFAGRGLSNTTRIIIYDNGKDHRSARLFWTLEYVGATNVAVLNGGLKQWQAEQGGISTVQVHVEPGTFVATVDPAKLPTAAQCHTGAGRSDEGDPGCPVAGGISGGGCAGQVQRPHAWRGAH